MGVETIPHFKVAIRWHSQERSLAEIGSPFALPTATRFRDNLKSLLNRSLAVTPAAAQITYFLPCQTRFI